MRKTGKMRKWVRKRTRERACKKYRVWWAVNRRDGHCWVRTAHNQTRVCEVQNVYKQKQPQCCVHEETDRPWSLWTRSAASCACKWEEFRMLVLMCIIVYYHYYMMVFGVSSNCEKSANGERANCKWHRTHIYASESRLRAKIFFSPKQKQTKL